MLFIIVFFLVLVGLYEEPEKPNDALDFIRQHLGADGPDTGDVESLKLEVTELRQKCEQLTEENAELKAKVKATKLSIHLEFDSKAF